jgi:hypothetical protein
MCYWQVALESVRIQTAINDAILNLVDKVGTTSLLFIIFFCVCVSVYFAELIYMFCTMQFFEMQRDDAITALDMYKRAISQVNHDFFSSSG